MTTASPKAHLDSYELFPKKSLGQHFMHDPQLLDKIVDALAVEPGATVVEVGAGTGALTDKLARGGLSVFAIEVDQRLQPLLEERFDDASNVYLVFDDVLKTDINALVGGGDYVVAANMPYYISSAILWHFLEAPNPPQRLALTMQYEVALRIAARDGAMSLLSIATQFYGAARIISKLSPAVFWPRPNVDSALVRIETHASPPVAVPSRSAFFRVAKAGFSQKRKQLRNALSGGLQVKAKLARDWLHAADIEPKRRAETLSLDEWARLTRAIADAGYRF